MTNVIALRQLINYFWFAESSFKLSFYRNILFLALFFGFKRKLEDAQKWQRLCTSSWSDGIGQSMSPAAGLQIQQSVFPKMFRNLSFSDCNIYIFSLTKSPPLYLFIKLKINQSQNWLDGRSGWIYIVKIALFQMLDHLKPVRGCFQLLKFCGWNVLYWKVWLF